MDLVVKKLFESVHEEVVADKTLTTEHKDQLHAALYKAEEASNGAKEKVQAMSEAIALWIIMGVRRELRTPQEIRSAILEHSQGCREMFEETIAKHKEDEAAEGTDGKKSLVSGMDWIDVAKMAVLKCPYAAAIVISAFVFKGFGEKILTLVGQ